MADDDGLRRPFNAPEARALLPGIQPGVSSGVVVADLVVVYGAAGGVFVYSSAPAFGNLIASIASSAGFDPYGNAYLAGLTGYFLRGSTYFATQTGAIFGIQAWLSASAGGPWLQCLGFSADGTNAFMQSNAKLVALSSWVGASPAGGAETWHPLTFAGTWANSGVGVAGQYQRLPTDEIEVIGDLTPPAGSPNSLIATLQTGYNIASLQQIDVTVITSTGAVSVLTPRVFASGSPVSLTSVNIPAGTTRIFIRGKLSTTA